MRVLGNGHHRLNAAEWTCMWSKVPGKCSKRIKTRGRANPPPLRWQPVRPPSPPPPPHRRRDVTASAAITAIATKENPPHDHRRSIPRRLRALPAGDAARFHRTGRSVLPPPWSPLDTRKRDGRSAGDRERDHLCRRKGAGGGQRVRTPVCAGRV